MYTEKTFTKVWTKSIDFSFCWILNFLTLVRVPELGYLTKWTAKSGKSACDHKESIYLTKAISHKINKLCVGGKENKLRSTNRKVLES